MKRYNVFINRILKDSKESIIDAIGIYAENEVEAIETVKKQLKDHHIKYIKIFGAIETKKGE